jgi:hypothetical protein
MFVHTFHWPYGIHFLCCVHGNKHMKTHDAICDTFVAIAWNVIFHVGQKKLHVSPSTMFNSTCWLVNIMSTKDEICTLADVVITNPTWSNLFFWLCTIQGFCYLRCNSSQRKKLSWPPLGWSTPPFSNWSIWMFTQTSWCVKHNCANPIWSLKKPKGLPLLFRLFFFVKKIQRMKAYFILSHEVVVGPTFQLPPLQNTC